MNTLALIALMLIGMFFLVAGLCVFRIGVDIVQGKNTFERVFGAITMVAGLWGAFFLGVRMIVSAVNKLFC